MFGRLLGPLIRPGIVGAGAIALYKAYQARVYTDNNSTNNSAGVHDIFIQRKIGDKTISEIIEDKFKTQQVVVLKGKSGTGKTFTAERYGIDKKIKYLTPIDASSNGSIRRALENAVSQKEQDQKVSVVNTQEDTTTTKSEDLLRQFLDFVVSILAFFRTKIPYFEFPKIDVEKTTKKTLETKQDRFLNIQKLSVSMP